MAAVPPTWTDEETVWSQGNSLIRDVPGDPLETPELQLQRALLDCAALDTAAEPGFDNIAAPDVPVLDMPMALVGLSDRYRKWFKSRVDFAAAEIAREFSFQDSVVRLQNRRQRPIQGAVRAARLS
jgi:hypothetical protein